MNEMFKDYLILMGYKNRWQAREIPFERFDNAVYHYCETYNIERNTILYSLNVFPI